MQVKSQQLELDMKQQIDWFNWERSTSRLYIVTLLISVQSTSCEMLAGMNHKLEPRVLREIPTTSDMQVLPG